MEASAGNDPLLRDLETAAARIAQGADLTRKLRAAVGGAEPIDLLSEARQLLRAAGETWQADHLAWTPANEWRPFYADRFGRDRVGIGVALQKATFAILFQGHGEHVVFPAAGLDAQLLDGDPSFLTVGPHESEHAPHINKYAEDLDDDDLAAAKPPRALVLKGLQTLVRPKDLVYLVGVIAPRRVIACGTAKPTSKDAVGYPSLDDSLRQSLAKAGFHDRTSEHLPNRAVELLLQAHGDLERYFAFGDEGGWFPLSQVEVYAQ